MDGTGGDFFKTSISHGQFLGDTDNIAPRSDGIGASRAIIPLVEAIQRATSQDYILLESDAKR
jgi:hypothetical protein